MSSEKIKIERYVARHNADKHVEAVKFEEPWQIKQIMEWLGKDVLPDWEYICPPGKCVADYVISFRGNKNDSSRYLATRGMFIRKMRDWYCPLHEEVFLRVYKKDDEEAIDENELSKALFLDTDLIEKLEKMARICSDTADTIEKLGDMSSVCDEAIRNMKDNYNRAELWKELYLKADKKRVELQKQLNEICGDPKTLFGKIKRMNINDFSEWLGSVDECCCFSEVASHSQNDEKICLRYSDCAACWKDCLQRKN